MPADGRVLDGTVFKFTDSSAWVITALDSDLDHVNDVVSGMSVDIEPLTPESAEAIIIKEKPDAILPTMGGQTALNLAVDQVRAEPLERFARRWTGA